MEINIRREISPEESFRILMQSYHVELFENPSFKVNEFGELVVYRNDELFDDRGELYLALYHLATKIFPNTEFRSRFENPNVEIAELYNRIDKFNLKY